jgi:hypothetical protein
MSAFWWNATEDYESIIDANINYIYDTYEGSEAYVNFAKKVNEGIAIYNSVGGNKKDFTEQQKKDFDKIMLEADELQKYSNEWASKDPIKRITMNSHRERYNTAKWLSIGGISIGVIVSLFGFYFWHTRLQKYIDAEIKNKSA